VTLTSHVPCACSYCKSGETSLCDTTNDSHDMKMLYGDDVSGVHGYGHLTGGCAYSSGSPEFSCSMTARLHCMHCQSPTTDRLATGVLLVVFP
jgi:hypothetical protein